MTEVFLKIEGPDIPGESRDLEHKGEIEVLGWSLNQRTTGAQAGGGQAGRFHVEDMIITKPTDAATPLLSLHNANGTSLEKATISNRRSRERFSYLEIELSRVLITQVSINANADEHTSIDTIALNFAEFVMTYTPTNPDGSAGEPIVGGRNVFG